MSLQLYYYELNDYNFSKLLLRALHNQMFMGRASLSCIKSSQHSGGFGLCFQAPGLDRSPMFWAHYHWDPLAYNDPTQIGIFNTRCIYFIEGAGAGPEFQACMMDLSPKLGLPGHENPCFQITVQHVKSDIEFFMFFFLEFGQTSDIEIQNVDHAKTLSI